MCDDAPWFVPSFVSPLPSILAPVRVGVRSAVCSPPHPPPSGAQRSEMEEQLRRLHEDKLAAETSVATLQNLYLAQVYYLFLFFYLATIYSSRVHPHYFQELSVDNPD